MGEVRLLQLRIWGLCWSGIWPVVSGLCNSLNFKCRNFRWQFDL